MDELSQYVDDQIDNSRSYYSDIRDEQDVAEKYYFLRQDGDLAVPEIDGRSGFVSSDVADLVEWMLPSLIEMFTSSNDAVALEPQGAEDQENAQLWTDYLNYIFYRKNRGFVILYQMIKDVLVKKTGIVRVDWNINKDRIRTIYRGLTNEQIQLLDGEIIAATPRDDGLFDVEHEYTREKGGVLIQNCHNNEIFVSPDAKLGEKPAFIAQVTNKTLTELRNEGWEVSDDAAGADNMQDQPLRYGSQTWNWDNGNQDPSMREVKFIDAYCYYDIDGDGIAEYLRVVKAGSELLLAEEVDDHPFAVATGIIVPHEWYGVSPADQAMDFQKLNTDVMRAFIDNLQMQVNGRMGVVEGQANIDDLLTIRPGGLVRMKNQGAVFPLQQPNVLNDAMSAVQVFDTQKENRTGWTKYSQGTDSNSLNKTATGINIITNRGDMRVKLVARCIAETGVTELFKKIMKVAGQNATAPEQFRLNGKVAVIDPREGAEGLNFVVNVGLGAGNKDQRIAHITNMIQMQEKAIQMGVATPANVYNAMTRLAEETGFKDSDLLFTNPNGDQENPEMAQMQQQLQQAEDAIGQLKGMLEQQQNESAQRIQALEQQLENVGETEKTKQAMIEADIQREKTRQKEIDLMLLQANNQVADIYG